MDAIPKIISTKDLAYLSDVFEWNYTAFKQVNHYISEVVNEDVKELLERVRNMHEDHMNFIIAIMKDEDYCDCEECDCDIPDSDDEEDEKDE